MTEEDKKEAMQAEYKKLLDMRSGGTYVPPARLRALQAQIMEDTSDEAERLRQKLHWEALKKSITGIINKVNFGNIKMLVPELFEENLVKGRGLFCRSIMRAQASSLGFTPIYACLTAIINSKIPLVGELLARRLIMQFRKSFRRDDKKVCVSSTTFIAQLINFQVLHENCALQILQLLLHKPTDDSVEVAVAFMKEIGQFLTEMKPKASQFIFDKFRDVLHEASLDKRVQYMVEVLFQVRKDNFKDNPAVREELDLLEEDDMVTHVIELDDKIDTQETLNIFKFDPEFEKTEQEYIKLKREILGEATDDEEDSDEDESSEEEDEEEERAVEIKDQSNTDLVNLRRTIYLTIQSAMTPEEAVHKLIKINLPQGQEGELPSMVVECCSQAPTYQKFFGLIGERFAKLNRLWNELFEAQFKTTYDIIHRYETNRLRNVARFFGHMFASDALGWHAMSCVVMTEDATTSSSRIFCKILFQEIAEIIGLAQVAERMKDPMLQPSLEGLFPHDEAKNVRFSINYFTSIGMGVLTEEMREFLQNMPKPSLPAPPEDSDSVSASSSASSYTSSSHPRSRSRSATPRRDRRDRSRSRGRSSTRSRSSSRSASPRRDNRSRSYYSKSPSRKRARQYSSSRSRSPSPRRSSSRGGRYDSSPSKSPPRRRYRSDSRSRSPRGRQDDRSVTRSRSRSVRSARRSPTRSASSVSRSRSPTPKRRRATRSLSPRSRSRSRSRSHSRSVSRSVSRSPTPTPDKRRRGDVSSRGRDRSRSPAGKRRRYSSSRERSPAPPPTKRGRTGD